MKSNKHKGIIIGISTVIIICLSIISINMFTEVNNMVYAYGNIAQDAIEVSIINLIATPEIYDGKLVRVIGIGKVKFESNGLYLSKEDYKKAVTKNALWIDVDEERLGITYENLQKSNGKHVLIEGIFNSRGKGHFDRYSGAIEKITRFEFWK
jgi:hypothetical protein